MTDLKKPSQIEVDIALGEDFDMASVSRGRLLAKEGAVSNLIASPYGNGWRLAGGVKGSGRLPYRTQVEVLNNFEELEITSTCSCPVAEQCKHGVALLLDWLTPTAPLQANLFSFPNSPITSSPAKPISKSPTAPLQAMDKKLATWLRMLEADLAQVPLMAKRKAALLPARLGFMMSLNKTNVRIDVFYGLIAEGKSSKQVAW